MEYKMPSLPDMPEPTTKPAVTVKVLFCDVDHSWTIDGINSSVVHGLGKLSGHPMNWTHAALLVDTTAMGGFECVYELTYEGISEASPKDWEGMKDVTLIFEIEDVEKDYAFTQEVLDRISAAQFLDLKADWLDLVRLMIGRPMRNHNCVSFIRYCLGYNKDDTIYTVDHLKMELQSLG